MHGVDRTAVNTALTALLQDFGVRFTEADDDDLNEVTHVVADFIDAHRLLADVPEGLLRAAREMWDSNATLTTAQEDNPEYLRGQVETILQVTDTANIDTELAKRAIAEAIFRPGVQ
jgi:predicted component of type VI protein secretion system